MAYLFASELQPHLGMNTAAAWSTEHNNTEKYIKRWNELEKNKENIFESRT